MKLYLFDSCPYCVRVRALIGLKQLDCRLDFVVAGQLPDTLSGRLETRQVPILEIDDHNCTTRLIHSSQQILTFLDQLTGKPLLATSEPGGELIRWIDQHRHLLNTLCYPRMPALGLPELGSPLAMAYFQRSRPESLGMSLAEVLAQTDALLEQIRPALVQLQSLLAPQALVAQRRSVRIDDLYAFAELRTLTMVDELRLPPSLHRYLDWLSHATKIPLYSPSGQLKTDQFQADQAESIS